MSVLHTQSRERRPGLDKLSYLENMDAIWIPLEPMMLPLLLLALGPPAASKSSSPKRSELLFIKEPCTNTTPALPRKAEKMAEAALLKKNTMRKEPMPVEER